MKKLFLITFMITPFFLLSSDPEESKLAIVDAGRATSPQRSATDRFIDRDNPLDGGEGLAAQITDVKKGQGDHASNIAELAKSHAKETKKADGKLGEVEKATEKAVTEEKQQHIKETIAYKKAEKKWETIQRCINSPFCCCCLFCCPLALECGCWRQPDILKELDEEVVKEDQQRKGDYAEEMTRDDK